jgi:hypothetical protein
MCTTHRHWPFTNRPHVDMDHNLKSIRWTGNGVCPTARSRSLDSARIGTTRKPGGSGSFLYNLTDSGLGGEDMSRISAKTKRSAGYGNGVCATAHSRYGCGRIRLGLAPRGNGEGAEFMYNLTGSGLGGKIGLEPLRRRREAQDPTMECVPQLAVGTVTAGSSWDWHHEGTGREQSSCTT